MKIFTIDLYDRFGLKKTESGGYLTAYIADDVLDDHPARKRPAMLVIPGGGYSFVSPREAEPIALSFLSKGFNSFVLDYTVRKPFPTELIEADLAMAYIRKYSDELSVQTDKIACVGFSAGGHLAACLSTIPTEKAVTEYFESNGIFVGEDKERLFRPNAAVLSYPVITMDSAYTHAGTAEIVTGGDNGLIAALSMEKRVTASNPPTFIWHTADDDCVPVMNSLRFAAALSDHGVPFSLRIYKNGPHGLSLCNDLVSEKPYEASGDIANWHTEAHEFLKSFGFDLYEKRS